MAVMRAKGQGLLSQPPQGKRPVKKPGNYAGIAGEQLGKYFGQGGGSGQNIDPGFKQWEAQQAPQGQMQRVSAGVYRDDSGNLVKSKTGMPRNMQPQQRPMQPNNQWAAGIPRPQPGDNMGVNQPFKRPMPMQPNAIDGGGLDPNMYQGRPPFQQMPGQIPAWKSQAAPDGKPYPVSSGFVGGFQMSDGSWDDGKGNITRPMQGQGDNSGYGYGRPSPQQAINYQQQFGQQQPLQQQAPQGMNYQPMRYPGGGR